MNKYIILLFSAIIFDTTLAQQHDDACVQPTEYVLQWLKKSTTLWRCSQEWKNLDAKQHETAYAKTHITEYCGNAAKFFRLSENGIKATFVIHKNDDNTVEVQSEIEDMEVRQATQQDLENIQKLSQNSGNETQSDFSTKCNFLTSVVYDSNRNQLRVRLKSSCLSKFPLEKLKKAV